MIAAPEPISAWHNPFLSPVGCVGNVSTPDPVAEIRAAEAWLREQGCTVARGPLDGSTWFRYRANIGPHDRPLFLGEPDASPDPWRAAGYTERKRYCTILADNSAQIAATRQRDHALRAAGWTIQTLDEMGSFEEALDLYFEMACVAFPDNFSYSPIDRQGFRALYEPLQPLIRPELVLVARAPDGSPGGFSFNYPDHANPTLRQALVKSLAVLPEHRGNGLASWLVGETHRIAEATGLTGGCMHALMSSGNVSQNLSRNEGTLIREYVLFEKAL
jgi:GNAT superfamily N-acetyltransferase